MSTAPTAPDDLTAELIALYTRATGRPYPASRAERIALAGAAGVDYETARSMPDDAIAFAVVAELKRRDLATTEADAGDAWHLASWFEKVTRGHLYPDKLGAAARAGRIVARKRGGRNRYSVSEVAEHWPQYAHMIRAAHADASTGKGAPRRKAA